MKKMKFLLSSAIVIAGVSLASCGGKTEKTSDLEDSVVEFVQSELKAEIMQQLDSMRLELGQYKAPSFLNVSDDNIQLTEDEKKVKPDYLLNPQYASEATLLVEKYRSAIALRMDCNIAKLYGIDTSEFDKAITKLIAEINDPALETNAKAEKLDSVTLATYYLAEKDAGRINYFWQSMAAANVESLFIMSRNIEKFTSTLDDAAAADISKRLASVNVSANALVDFDKNMEPVVKAMALLKDINAKNVAELRQQLTDKKTEIEQSRNLLFKFFYVKMTPNKQ